ncbi:serine hydrolase [Salmonirosea aquatica]|uniref:Serine hydrolase n=1 Tax=Salmonirosea aquatica TaxID=2654236 RepID=A0A7C9BF08_9BACT|nr:serine hydrolase [Cytophagaceae bacterium SJW1-29]
MAYQVKKAFKEYEFIGNVVVVDSDQIIYKGSFDKANAEAGVPNNDSTRFLLASLSKPFTAFLY